MKTTGHPPIKVDHPLADEAKSWSLPDMTEQQADDVTNALGKKTQWKFEPPEEVIEPEPLTAEQIEQIRQDAYQEGFNQGKEEGFAQGYEEGKQQGFESGEQAGQEQGLAQGLEQGQAQIDELTAQWQQLLEHLYQPLNLVDKHVEQELVHLVVQLTEAVVKQEVNTNLDILTQAISEGVKALPSQQSEIQIYLNPEDIVRVEQAFGEQHIQQQGWILLPLPQLEVGGCQIENNTSNIDLSVKARLKEVLDSFLQQALHK